MDSLQKRYDFVYLFDVKDGNPNGDPDAGNLPRIDAETNDGIVTDVCLKRKVRNYVHMIKAEQPNFDIYVKEKAILGHFHVKAFNELGIALGQDARILVEADFQEALEAAGIPDGVSFEEDNDNNQFLVIASDADIQEIKKQVKELNLSKQFKKNISDALKSGKFRKPTAEESSRGREWMCKHFYDIRTFGAVMSLKSAPNCGQVRGPIQLTFARSVGPVFTAEHSITRMAVATEREAQKQSGDNRTMGRKFTIPYGLYRAHGFISAPLANQTGFSQEDLDLFWEALENMFDHDRSAARGLMSARHLIIFEHGSLMGNKSAQKLFDRVSVKRGDDKETPARDFGDFKVKLDEKELSEFKTVVQV
ncbi:MAG: type I-C CRISPR-associated protein Cas7/Csd2 [Helicobacteraceae bacterium]|jgi:CRISPR-associated protein Csd2|nr:type I-C CRISPR-associated protein Cas7/Csd2 [Helicobacteraceae bacterium]